MPVRRGYEKSAVADHAWENHHSIHWEETTVLDHSRGQEPLVMDRGPAHPDDTLRVALQSRRTGSSWLLDHCDEEAGRSSFYLPLTSNNVYSQ